LTPYTLVGTLPITEKLKRGGIGGRGPTRSHTKLAQSRIYRAQRYTDPKEMRPRWQAAENQASLLSLGNNRQDDKARAESQGGSHHAINTFWNGNPV